MEPTPTIRIVSGNGGPNTDVTVQVELAAFGNEVATQYSLNFNPAQLSISGMSGSNPNVTLGAGAPSGTTITVNGNNVAAGQIGIVENFNGGGQGAIPRGTRRIANVTFHILPGVAVGTVSPITFGDVPVTRVTTDANGIALVTLYDQTGTITVTGPRVLKFVNSSTVAGGTALVPVTLTAQGNEFGVSFSANFNPALLSISNVSGSGNPDVIAGTGLPPGCNRNVNTSQVAQGRIGVIVACPVVPGSPPIAAGTQEIVRLRFRALPAAIPGTQTLVIFGDNPTGTDVNDITGTTVPFSTINGVVSILGTTAAQVEVAGRVTTSDGRGLRNATVTITDQNGVARVVTTSSFGFYQFEDVDSGQTYIIGVASRRYQFTSRTIQVVDNLANVDFVAQE